MRNTANKLGFEQISLMDLLTSSKNLLKEMSSAELSAAIGKLQKVEQKAAERERKEQIRQQEEERERKEGQMKKEAHIQEVTCMDLPMDWNNIFDTDVRTQRVHFDSISDALVHCLATLGKVDIEYISSVTGADCKTVISTLSGVIYQNPAVWNECFYKGWETAEEYLSGNLMRKWNIAVEANEKYNGYFADNISAIEKVLPPQVATKDIYITLGSPWVPADIIDDFIEHLFGIPTTIMCYRWKDADA